MISTAKNLVTGIASTVLRPLRGGPDRSEAARKAAATREANAQARRDAARKAAETRRARAQERSATAKRAARTRQKRTTQRKERIEAMVDATTEG